MKKSLFLAIIAILSVSLVSCNKKDSNKLDPTGAPVYTIHRFADNPYLAEIWWGQDYDPAEATQTLNNKYNVVEGGACSSWHKDNFHGRNIDWTMRDFATIIIHMPRIEGKVKYASISLIAGNPVLTKDFIDNNDTVPAKYRSLIPASVIDGMNEKGVAINHNIVPYDGKEYEKNGDITTVMLCRYVLDNCATAQEAVDLLQSKKVTQAVVRLANDYSHFFISDPTCSYVVEWIDGQFVATKFTSDGNGNFLSENNQPAVMTNYFVGMAEKYGLGTNEFYKNHREGAGVERAHTIMDMLPNATTVEDHLNICKAVWYRQFCQGKTNWASENAGAYGYDETTGKAWWSYPNDGDPSHKHVMDNDDVYAAAVDLINSDVFKTYYEDFNANGDTLTPTNSYWYTQHSVVYDVKNLKGYIVMQEGRFSDKAVEVSIR